MRSRGVKTVCGPEVLNGVPTRRLMEIYRRDPESVWFKRSRVAKELRGRLPEALEHMTGREAWGLSRDCPWMVWQAQEMVGHPGFPFPEWMGFLPSEGLVLWGQEGVGGSLYRQLRWVEEYEDAEGWRRIQGPSRLPWE